MIDDPYDARSDASAENRQLYSVAQIHHILRVEFGRSARHRYPLSCLVLAVDRLESFRDRHGYDVKERVLDHVVLLLRNATRSSDYLGRTADDRLVAVVPHTDFVGARALSQRLLERARGSHVERLPETFPLSLSIGTASTGDGVETFHDVILAGAERALEEAIAAGGGRVVDASTVASRAGRASPPG